MPSASTITAASVKPGALSNCRSANLKSRIMSGVVAERDHRIGAGCAKCGNATGEQCDRGQCDSYKSECRGVERTDVVEQSRERPGRHERQDQTDHGANADELRGVPNYQPQD